MKSICISAPVYNEASVIVKFVKEVYDTAFLLKDRYKFSVLLVNDGSTDATERILEDLGKKYGPSLKVANLSRNFGHAAACKACIDFAEGDALILMDSDLQDDPAAIPQFLEKWEEGFAVVYAVRSSRTEGILFNSLFSGFYRILRFFSDIPIPLDAGTFSLIDKRVHQLMKGNNEKNAYLPGIRAMIGFDQIGVPIARRERQAERSRVGFWGLVRLAKNAVFSFSFLPIRVFYLLGLITLAATGMISVFVLYHRIWTSLAVPSWASQMITTMFLGGINLVGIGIVGEYVARIYDEVRNRDVFVVRDFMVGGSRSDNWR